jgi:hypothetical protein
MWDVLHGIQITAQTHSAAACAETGIQVLGNEGDHAARQNGGLN